MDCRIGEILTCSRHAGLSFFVYRFHHLLLAICSSVALIKLYNSEELWTVELAKFSLVHAMLDYRFLFIGFIICCLPFVFCSFDMLYNSEELWTVELAKFSTKNVHAMLDYRFLFIGFIICCLPFVFCSFDMLYNYRGTVDCRIGEILTCSRHAGLSFFVYRFHHLLLAICFL